MKTTNILLSLIVLLLFFNLVKSSNLNLFPTATAQENKHQVPKADTLNVRIIGFADNITGALPVIYGSSY